MKLDHIMLMIKLKLFEYSIYYIDMLIDELLILHNNIFCKYYYIFI